MKNKKSKDVETILFTAIRKQCLECVGHAFTEVELCTAPKCSLYKFRFGRLPEPNDLVYIPDSKNKYRTNENKEIRVIDR